MNPAILMKFSCTFCGADVFRFPSQQINPKTGAVRKVVKCRNCRKVDPEKLFWRMVKKDGHPKGCWEWQGSTLGGYAIFVFGELKESRGHRISWRLAHNKAPVTPGLQVLHKVECHNRRCVNPDHLYEGNESRNALDQLENGTHPSFTERGEQHYNAILNNDAVREIRREYRRFNVKPLASKFGVSLATIMDVAKGRSWKHVS